MAGEFSTLNPAKADEENASFPDAPGAEEEAEVGETNLDDILEAVGKVCNKLKKI